MCCEENRSTATTTATTCAKGNTASCTLSTAAVAVEEETRRKPFLPRFLPFRWSPFASPLWTPNSNPSTLTSTSTFVEPCFRSLFLPCHCCPFTWFFFDCRHTTLDTGIMCAASGERRRKRKRKRRRKRKRKRKRGERKNGAEEDKKWLRAFGTAREKVVKERGHKLPNVAYCLLLFRSFCISLSLSLSQHMRRHKHNARKRKSMESIEHLLCPCASWVLCYPFSVFAFRVICKQITTRNQRVHKQQKAFPIQMATFNSVSSRQIALLNSNKLQLSNRIREWH